MTTLAAPSRAARRGRPASPLVASLPGWTIAAAAAIAVLGRLPFVGRAPGPDESGFLLVGAQWNGAGSSLYGNYFVDRPPLLVSIFRCAASLGGITALRLIGCLAVLLIVLGCAHAATLISGQQAGRWTAVTAAALCLSPLLGGYDVNGEMLAAPFVIGGIIAVVRAIRADDSTVATRWAVLAGAAGVSAILVKQNFADVAVFGAVAMTLSALRADISWRRFQVLGIAAAVGGAVALAVVSAWTVVHGTSLRGVFDAMYPFRVHAGQAIAAGGGGHASARLVGLVAVAVSSMIIPLMALAVIAVTPRRRRDPLSSSVLVLLAFETASVLVGGNFWHHYLIGLIVPVSLAAGWLAVEGRRLVRPVIALAVASSVIAWVGSFAVPPGSDDHAAGAAVGQSSQPTDTIINLYGHADVVEASGLSSPYEHLWSLPVKTLDPHLTELDAVLSGPEAPTWLLTGRSVRSWGLTTASTASIIRRDYREVDTICGRTVYLRDAIDRPAPRPVTDCRGASPASITKRSPS